MSSAPLRPCPVPRCPNLVSSGRCTTHAVQREHQRSNYTDRRRYRQARWLRLRAQVLVEAAHRCNVCKQVTLELDVDHIEKPGQDPDMFYNRKNLQALCKRCHSAKTASGA